MDIVTTSLECELQEQVQRETQSDELMFKIAIGVLHDKNVPPQVELEAILSSKTSNDDKESFLWIAATRLKNVEMLKLATCIICSTRSIMVEESITWIPPLKTIVRLVDMVLKGDVREWFIAKLATKMISKINYHLQNDKLENDPESMSINMLNLKLSYLAMLVTYINDNNSNETYMHFDALCVELTLSLEKYNNIVNVYGIPYIHVDFLLDKLIIMATDPTQLESSYKDVVKTLVDI